MTVFRSVIYLHAASWRVSRYLLPFTEWRNIYNTGLYDLFFEQAF